MKKRVTTYYCKTRTEAIDRSNLYYISSPTAAGIQASPEAIKVTTREGRALAIFYICAQ